MEFTDLTMTKMDGSEATYQVPAKMVEDTKKVLMAECRMATAKKRL